MTKAKTMTASTTPQGHPVISVRDESGPKAAYIMSAFGLDLRKPIRRKRRYSATCHFYGNVVRVWLLHYRKKSTLFARGWFAKGKSKDTVMHGVSWTVSLQQGAEEMPFSFDPPKEDFNYVPVLDIDSAKKQPRKRKLAVTEEEINVKHVGLEACPDIFVNEKTGRTEIRPVLIASTGLNPIIFQPWTYFEDHSLKFNHDDPSTNVVEKTIEWDSPTPEPIEMEFEKAQGFDQRYVEVISYKDEDENLVSSEELSEVSGEEMRELLEKRVIAPLKVKVTLPAFSAKFCFRRCFDGTGYSFEVEALSQQGGEEAEVNKFIVNMFANNSHKPRRVQIVRAKVFNKKQFKDGSQVCSGPNNLILLTQIQRGNSKLPRMQLLKNLKILFDVARRRKRRRLKIQKKHWMQLLNPHLRKLKRKMLKVVNNQQNLKTKRRPILLLQNKSKSNQKRQVPNLKRQK